MASGIDNCTGKEYIIRQTSERVIGKTFFVLNCRRQEMFLTLHHALKEKNIHDYDIIGIIEKNTLDLINLSVAVFSSNDKYYILLRIRNQTNFSNSWHKKTVSHLIQRASKSSHKESFLFKPNKIIKNELLSPEEYKTTIIEAFNVFGLKGKVPKEFSNQVPKILNSLEKDERIIIEDLPMMPGLQEAIRDYFCELLAPLWLVNQCYQDSNAKIGISQGNNAKLYDSFLLLGERKINISSKGGKTGASAAISSLGHLVNQIYNKELNEIYRITKLSSVQAPLFGLVRNGLITNKDAKIVLQLLETHEQSDLELLSPNAKNILTRRLTENGKIGYWVLSNMAKEYSNILNQNYNMSETIQELLMKDNFVQIYSNIETKENGSIEILPFKSLVPGRDNLKIIVEADKSYYSTRLPQGSIGFKIKTT